MGRTVTRASGDVMRNAVLPTTIATLFLCACSGSVNPCDSGTCDAQDVDDASDTIATIGVSDTNIYQYRIASDTWVPIPNLPFGHGQNGGCTVTDSGYLYVIAHGAPADIARLRLL